MRIDTVAGDELIVWREGTAGRIRLNRPRALNALTHNMCLAIEDVLLAWIDDDRVKCVIIEGEGEKAFCAGGDVMPIFQHGKDLAPFWFKEYRLNHLIKHYPKPYVALVDGFDMGGGVGVSSHGSHVIVTENALLAMPEVSIGFIPDVGATWILSRAPGETGRYLGMTAARMRADDAILTGFATHRVPRDNLGKVANALVGGADPDDVCGQFAQAPEPGHIAEHRDAIDAIFSKDTAIGCRGALEAEAEKGAEWAAKALDALNYACPLSVAAIHEIAHLARSFPDIEQCLALEYRFAWNMMDGTNFQEGVRALLVDKDRKPKWTPARLEDVTSEMIAASFAPLPPGEEWSLAAAGGRAVA
ncbi:enoyl-CoA hydratase/isomerase family protein [Oricola cellulosilytica]|uniref:3-hydroxyisobutyryl-CoA hydrolase n=1 Tax=Oricola cellulosilytica TaxID=1429082 RepID=A0A4R0PBS8_9HYPH|nr:enoyl-CoA hydratase/isomerase family protein [Oricola cellulosilytica]TCD14912.1 enoyl-CoA hydratase/isomerase family protein [Oricola cellulosilytica]